jgi:2-polyprenyl-3-methyl-5-hydroxy-6-metoxy-1,4-benzoquinol methylase
MNEHQGYPERIIPSETAPGIVAIHLKRYAFARDYVGGKRVLDIACGVGYGTQYLAETATEVIGVDLDSEAIQFACDHYASSANVRFVQGDALQVPLEDASFDVICSFETIEHVPDVDRFLREVRRLLKPDGVFLVSTPAARHSTSSPENPHHVQEWSPRDFEALLRMHFGHVELFSQMRRETPLSDLIKRLDIFKLRTKVSLSLTRRIAASAGVRTMGDINLSDVLIVPGIHARATEILAVLRNQRNGS